MKNRTALACLVLAALPAAAQQPGLTLGEAQRRAVERSSQLTAQDAAIEASRHLAKAARALPDPVLKAGVDNLPVTGPERFTLGSDFMTMRRVGLMQEFTRGEKRELRSERYDLEARKSEAEREGAIAAIQRDAGLAWIDRYYAEAMQRAAEEQLAAARLEIEGAQSAYRAARGSQGDVLNARAALAALEDRAAEYRRRAATARIALARWVGARFDAPLAGKPAFGSVRASHHEESIDSHPMIAALALQEDIARSEAKLATASGKPDWSVELVYSNRGPGFSDMVSIGFSVPLPWDRANRQDQEVAARLATARQAHALREDAVRVHTAEIQAMRAEWESDRERLQRYDKELVPLAKELAEAALAAYRGGKSSLVEVLAARRGEIDVRLQALQLEWDTARMWAQLNFLVPDDALLPAGFAIPNAEGVR